MDDTPTAPLRRLDQEVMAATGWSLQVRDEGWQDVAGRASLWLVSATGSQTGISVDTADGEEQRVVGLAGQVQDFVHEELWTVGLPTAWPLCPPHPGTHPLTPTLHEGQAWWECPRSQQPIRRIGVEPQGSTTA